MTRDLYERHFEELMRYCLQLCRSREAALDLVQETFLKALEREEAMDAYIVIAQGRISDLLVMLLVLQSESSL